MPMDGARILVLAPHPDDEIVGCAAAAARAREAGASLHVLYLTNGVPLPDQLWPWQRGGRAARVARRWREAGAAAARLGIAQAGRLDIPTRTLKAHLPEARDLVAKALAETRAETMWAPAWEGAHQDHDVANYLASRFAGRVELWEYAAYTFAGGTVRSQAFPAITGGEIVLTLGDAEAAEKRRLLACYASEAGNLRHIACAREAFRPLPPHDYGARPHPGRLFYERYRWVPFHPRLDRTRPEDVLASIAADRARAG